MHHKYDTYQPTGFFISLSGLRVFLDPAFFYSIALLLYCSIDSRLIINLSDPACDYKIPPDYLCLLHSSIS